MRRKYKGGGTGPKPLQKEKNLYLGESSLSLINIQLILKNWDIIPNSEIIQIQSHMC